VSGVDAGRAGTLEGPEELPTPVAVVGDGVKSEAPMDWVAPKFPKGEEEVL
jgi:hypothetical protein